MRLMHFDDRSYRLAIDTGYEFIVLQKKIERTHFAHPKERDLQILKAVRNCEALPANCVCEPIDSKYILGLFSDNETDYFIILMDT